MDRKYIVDNSVVPRYVAKQLSPDEAEAFELYYLEHPEILAEIADERLLRESFRFAGQSDGVTDDHRVRPVMAHRQHATYFAAAAAAILGVTTIASVTGWLQTREELSAITAPRANTQSLLLATVRGAPKDEPSTQIPLEKFKGLVLIEILLDDPALAPHTVDISTPDGQTINIEHLIPGYGDSLTMSVYADDLPAGIYDVAVSAGTGTASIQSFKFLVRD